MSTTDIKTVVREKYGEAALRVKGGGNSCCGTTANSGCTDPITSNLYDSTQAGQIPEEALLASLGCGNPTVLAKLNVGEVVLDLALAAVLTCCSPPSELGRPGKPTAWT